MLEITTKASPRLKKKMAPIIENLFRHTQDKDAYNSQASDLKGFVCVR